MKRTITATAMCLLSAFAVNRMEAQDTIPLIIHIVHHPWNTVGSGENLATAQIMSQFPILNADFAGQGWNVANVPPVWASLVGNANVVFVPATVDPSGNPLPEPGIERIDMGSNGWSISSSDPYAQQDMEAYVKPQTIWDHNLYCNVWITDIAFSYTYLPGTYTATNDGLVFNYKM